MLRFFAHVAVHTMDTFTVFWPAAILWIIIYWTIL